MEAQHAWDPAVVAEEGYEPVIRPLVKRNDV